MKARGFSSEQILLETPTLHGGLIINIYSQISNLSIVNFPCPLLEAAL